MRWASALAGAVVLGGLAAVAGAQPEPESEAALRERAARIHERALVLDGHNDIPTFVLDYGFDLGMDGTGEHKRGTTLHWFPVVRRLVVGSSADEIRTDTDLRRLREGGVDATFFSIFAHSRYEKTGESRERALAMIEALLEQTRRHGGLELAATAADVRRIASEGRIAVLMGLEGGHAIEDDLAHLRRFHELGVRYMTLTWSNANSWADSCYEEPHGGLTDFGREVVREMNRLGMLVDISHVSDRAFYAALEVTEAPVMASHSAARALVDHPRNMTDEMLRAVARNGGVVMVNLQDTFVDPAKAGYVKGAWHYVRNLGWKRTPLAMAIDHIDHVVEVAGIDHTGLGSDFAGTVFMPEDLEDVSKFPNVTLELLRRGYGEEEIRKILGGNALRVMEEAERVAGLP